MLPATIPDGPTGRAEPTNGNRLAHKPAIISLDQSRCSLLQRRRRHYAVTSYQQPRRPLAATLSPPPSPYTPPLHSLSVPPMLFASLPRVHAILASPPGRQCFVHAFLHPDAHPFSTPSDARLRWTMAPTPIASPVVSPRVAFPAVLAPLDPLPPPPPSALFLR